MDNTGDHRTMAPAPDDGLSMAEQMFANRGCCCFWIPCFSSNPSHDSGASSSTSSSVWWERIRNGEKGGGGNGESLSPSPSSSSWWRRGLRALRKVREWSELVAGPRWKTFIRRFNRNPIGVSGGGCGGGRNMRRFQYDPLSYALNFDERNGGDSDGESGYRGFSARYAVPPVSAKSSMDLGGRDAPPLFAAG